MTTARKSPKRNLTNTYKHKHNVVQKQSTANSDPEDFEHGSKWRVLKTCMSEHLCGSQDFKALNLKESQEPNFLTRDTLFEMKLTLSSEASSMLPELNFK